MSDEPTPAPDPTPVPVPASAGRLEGFWDGDFTLGPNSDDPASTPSAPPAPAIDGLGGSGIRIGGRDLATLLAPAYRRLLGSLD